MFCRMLGGWQRRISLHCMLSVNQQRQWQSKRAAKEICVISVYCKTHLLKHFPFKVLFHKLLAIQGVVSEVAFEGLDRHKSEIIKSNRFKLFGEMNSFFFCRDSPCTHQSEVYSEEVRFPPRGSTAQGTDIFKKCKNKLLRFLRVFLFWWRPLKMVVLMTSSHSSSASLICNLGTLQ